MVEAVFAAHPKNYTKAVDDLAVLAAEASQQRTNLLPHGQIHPSQVYPAPIKSAPTAHGDCAGDAIATDNYTLKAQHVAASIAADSTSTSSSTDLPICTPTSSVATTESTNHGQEADVDKARHQSGIIKRMAVAFPELPQKVIETALKESNWDPDAGAVKIIDIMEAFAIQAAHRVADAEFIDDSDEEDDENENENPEDSYSDADSESDTDTNFSDFNDEIEMEIEAAQPDGLHQAFSSRNINIDLDIAENIVSFAEDIEGEASESSGQSRGQNWTIEVIGYPEPVAVQSLEQIPAFEKCFEQDPEKFEAKAPLRLSSHIPPDIFRMVLQWEDHELIILDEKRDDRLDVLIRFVHAATSLGMTVENEKAIISGMMKDILITEHDKNHFILNTSHVVTFFSTLKHVASLDPLRDLLAKAVTREFLAHRDDSHARGDDPVYDADAGPARRGLHGRTFRWDYELKNFPDLQMKLSANLAKILRTREVVDKVSKKSRPVGTYLADPLTGESRLWM